MKRFKQFLEENLIKQSLLEISGSNEGLFSMIPDTQSSALAGFYGAGAISNRRPVIFPPQRPTRPTNPNQRSPFLIYDNSGNVIGTDFNGDGQPDTEEELDQWRQTGLPPSDWLVDQPWYERWRTLTWEIAPWVLPFGGWTKVYGLASKLHNILNTILYHGSVALDAWDIMKLIEAIFTGNFDNLPQELLNIQQAIEAERQNLLNWLIENGLSSLIDALPNIWQLYQGTFTETPGSIPKMFYRFVPGTYVHMGTLGVDWDKVRVQLWRFNPATGTWEPFGPPMTWEEYVNHCGTPGSNCAPLDNGSIPFYPPLPRPLKQTLEPQTQTNEPMDQRPTNNHWNQQAPGGGSVGNGSNQPPNPNIFQM